MAKVIVTGWREGLQKISMDLLIRNHTPLGLAKSKAVTDRVLDGETVVLTVSNVEDAASLAAQLQAIGAEAHHEAA